MEDIICNVCYNHKIAEDVYLLDVLARNKDENSLPTLIGRVIVNIKTRVVSDSICLDFEPGYMNILSEEAYSAAVIAKKVIEGEE